MAFSAVPLIQCACLVGFDDLVNPFVELFTFRGLFLRLGGLALFNDPDRGDVVSGEGKLEPLIAWLVSHYFLVFRDDIPRQ